MDADGWTVLQVMTGPEKGISLILAVADLEAATMTAISLGAQPIEVGVGVRPLQRPSIGLPPMRSPGGLPFQFVQADPPSPLRTPPLKRTMLKQISINVPDKHWNTEVSFWSELTVSPTQQLGKHFVCFKVPSPNTLDLFMQRLESTAPAVGGHLDFTCPDRLSEMGRHVALGAVHVVERNGWSELEAPDGTPYCLTSHR